VTLAAEARAGVPHYATVTSKAMQHRLL
jgi:hypothetical protein